MGFPQQLAVYRNHRIASDDTAVRMIVENAERFVLGQFKTQLIGGGNVDIPLIEMSVYGLKVRENKMKKFLSPGAF